VKLTRIATSVVVTVLLVACSRVGADTLMLDSSTAIISGRGNALLFPGRSEVFQATLVQAAKTATERGFRFFSITSTSDVSETVRISQSDFFKPGIDVVVKMYRANEVDPNRAGIWDAESILGATSIAR
jgi:hypothetical protein